MFSFDDLWRDVRLSLFLSFDGNRLRHRIDLGFLFLNLNVGFRNFFLVNLLPNEFGLLVGDFNRSRFSLSNFRTRSFKWVLKDVDDRCQLQDCDVRGQRKNKCELQRSPDASVVHMKQHHERERRRRW